jgi:hypothetical protein
VRQGDPVIHEARPLSHLWQRKLPLVAEKGDFKSAKTDPLAFMTGPVVVEYDADAAKTKMQDVSKFISGSTIRSITGEHELDTEKGTFTLNTTHAQGVAAFFKNQREFTLPALTVKSENDYGTCVAVSLDGKPLAESAKVLIQAGTNTLPAGWSESPSDKPDIMKIDALGKAPWMMEKVRMSISLRNPELTKATALDANGYAKNDAPIERDGELIRLQLPEDALHVILE